MIRVVLLTSSGLRHKYFSARFFNSKKINHICSFEEDNSAFHNDKKKKLIYKHETQRHKYEIKSFKKYLIKSEKFRVIKVKKGAINNSSNINLIKKMKPDLIVSYGCSIINEKLIKEFRNRFLNIHLGLSPYYKGAGTNFFPFVKNELHFLGATLMFINKGVDTGKIIHQIRPEIYLSDNIQTIGNRIIKKIISDTIKIISLKKLVASNLKTSYKCKTFKKNDFNENSLKLAKKNLKNKIIKKFLKKKNYFNKKFPIIEII